jgi:hypothetical protein
MADDTRVLIVNRDLNLLLGANRSDRLAPPLLLDDRTLKIWSVLAGLDGAGRERPIALDAQRLLRTREFERNAWSPVVVLGGAPTVVYTAPTSTIAETLVYIACMDTVDRTVDYHVVPNGGAAGASNRMGRGVTVRAGDVGIKVGPFNVEPGGTIQALCSTAGMANAIPHVLRFGVGDAV